MLYISYALNYVRSSHNSSIFYNLITIDIQQLEREIYSLSFVSSKSDLWVIAPVCVSLNQIQVQRIPSDFFPWHDENEWAHQDKIWEKYLLFWCNISKTEGIKMFEHW